MGKTIKVAEFVTRLEFGGVEAVLLNYLTNFTEKEKFEFHIVSQDINFDACIKQFEDNGFIVHTVTHKRKSIWKNVGQIYQLLRREKFDIVHSHMTLTNFYVMFLAWITGVKVRISHSHGALKNRKLHKQIGFLLIRALDQMLANRHIACGYDAGVFLFGKKSVDSGKVLIMNNAIAVDKFKFNSAVRDKVREEYEMSDAVCVGHIGRFMAQKNHRFLIEVFDRLCKETQKYKLLLVGCGELEKDIRNYVNALGLDGRVIFAGGVTTPHEMYQAMDIFVLPSLFEGLPLAAIEAQTADLPCLIADTVDKKCALTNNVSFLPISKGTDIWVEKILETRKRSRSSEVINEIERAGYSITTEAQWLQNLYICSVENGHSKKILNS